MKTLTTVRDISLLQLSKDLILVIACDSAGGIGEKAEDTVKVKNSILGKYTVKVPLMEVLAVGAEVISVVDNLAVEYEPTGREIIAGIKENLKLISKAELLNGSTEENIPTVQTGMGITVIASINTDKLNQFTTSSRGSILAAVGLPLMGEQLLKNEELAVDFKKFIQLRQLNYIEEILPVGSKGILYELQILAEENGLDFELLETELDLKKSAGPASVVLVSLKAENFEQLQKDIDLPINKIGRLI